MISSYDDMINTFISLGLLQFSTKLMFSDILWPKV
jgi:hypothetical protein